MLLWSFLHLLILRFCCCQYYLELISRIIALARETESFIVHFNQRRRKIDCFSSCSKLVLLILQSLHALRFRQIKHGARESSLDDKKSIISDIKDDSEIKYVSDIKDDAISSTTSSTTARLLNRPQSSNLSCLAAARGL